MRRTEGAKFQPISSRAEFSYTIFRDFIAERQSNRFQLLAGAERQQPDEVTGPAYRLSPDKPRHPVSRRRRSRRRVRRGYISRNSYLRGSASAPRLRWRVRMTRGADYQFFGSDYQENT